MENIRDFVGKHIIRTIPCKCPYGLDYSYSIEGLYGKQNPEHHYAFLKMVIGKSMIIVWNLGDSNITTTLDPWWNDGKWILYEPKGNDIKTTAIQSSDPKKDRFANIIQ